MVSRPTVARLARIGPGAVAFAAVLVLGVLTAPVSACSGAAIPFERVVAHPGPIALVRVLDLAGNPQAPDRYRFAVDEVWRGTVPPVLEIESPVVHVCGDRLFAQRGDRLALALNVIAFDDAKPMAAFWVVDAEGRIDGTAVEERPGVTTLAGLRTILAPAGALPPAEEESVPVEASEDAGVPLVVALLAIASCVLGAAVLIAALARRRHRDERG